MHKVNTTKMTEFTWSSPKGKFVGAGKEISEELGRQPRSTDLLERHPFDVEILRIHYAKTCHEWYLRFIEHREEAKAMYDERFCRMFEFYLAAVEMTFWHGSAMVFQMQLSHKRDAVPLTRDYITDSDRALAAKRANGEL